MRTIGFPGIFAIDPGLTLGYVQLGADGNTLFAGTVQTDNYKVDIPPVPLPGSIVAIETIESYGQKVGNSTFCTSFQTGFLYGWYFSHGFDVLTISRKEAVSHILGTRTGNDAAVRRGIIEILGELPSVEDKGKLRKIKSHEISALAIGLTAFDQLGGALWKSKKFAETVRLWLLELNPEMVELAPKVKAKKQRRRRQ